MGGGRSRKTGTRRIKASSSGVGVCIRRYPFKSGMKYYSVEFETWTMLPCLMICLCVVVPVGLKHLVGAQFFSSGVENPCLSCCGVQNPALVEQKLSAS